MNCPYCKVNIDDDSLYCDQCGQEILICPKCNKPGKGKVCTHDGTPLIPMKVRIAVSSDKRKLHLINKTLGLDIVIDKDVLIGRVEGDFVYIFGKYPQVSGRHLRISFAPQKGWVATDLGSTNGTKYNNVPLIQNQPQVLADKSYLQIANIEFFVQLESPEQMSKTGTGTIRI